MNNRLVVSIVFSLILASEIIIFIQTMPEATVEVISANENYQEGDSLLSKVHREDKPNPELNAHNSKYFSIIGVTIIIGLLTTFSIRLDNNKPSNEKTSA